MENEIAKMIKDCSCYVFFGKDTLLIYNKEAELCGRFTVNDKQKTEIRKAYVGLESKFGC